jgi:hypothetical protein
VLPLEKDALNQPELARRRGRKLSALKGALPGVVPGSVIDYGYTLWEGSLSLTSRVTLQQDWPVREFRYRWTPWNRIPGAFRVYRTGGLSVETTRDSISVLVAGRELPSVRREPWSPPDNEMRAAVTFYYYAGERQPKEFWDSLVARVRSRAGSFAKERLVKETIASMQIPAGADLPARLKAAYDWIGAHLSNTDLQTAEQVEASALDEKDEELPGRTLKDLLERKEGPGWQLDYLFVGMARALGAEAEIVLAVDRTDHYLDEALLSAEQIDATLVAVRAPGDPDDKAIVVDPGSGLPYGHIPWWFSGLHGIASSPREARDIMLWPSDPRDNVSETTVSIAFDVKEGAANVQWTRTGSGQQGLAERRELRPMTPDKRGKRLEQYCGAGADFEVARAEAPRIQEMTEGLSVECEATLMAAGLQTGREEYRFGLDGPWFPDLPEFTSATRAQPVVFSFPHVDRTVMEIEAPEAMPGGTPPAPIRIESPYGSYSLSVIATPKGFHVERIFSLAVLGVPQNEYDPLRRYLSDARRADRTVLEFRRSEAAP